MPLRFRGLDRLSIREAIVTGSKAPQAERGWFLRAVTAMVEAQVTRPWAFIMAALAASTLAFFAARSLELHTGFDSLLPETKPSVVELKRVAERTAGVSTLAVVIEGSDPKAMQRFSDALLPKLRALGPNWVGTAENGVHAEREFLRERQALYLPVAKVREIHDRVEQEFQREVFGSIDDEPSDPITRATIEREFKSEADKQPKGPPYRDGYYMNAEGTKLIILVRTPVASGDLAGSQRLQELVKEQVVAAGPSQFHPSIRWGLTGDVVTSAEQYGVIKDDLTQVGIAGVLMILFIDFLFFLRVRAVLTMALAIGTGVLWTFALTRLVIGHLNTASGFLVSIIFGNGINFGILLRSRYGEARRAGASLREALITGYRDTFVPTLTASAAAGAGYMSLATTDFRGFRDFGAIGGYGMLLCWLANYLLMPPLLVLFERVLPSWGQHDSSTFWGRVQNFVDHGIPFGAPFAWFSKKAPVRFLVTAAVVVTALAAVVAVRYVTHDPFEYNLGRLENDASSSASTATRLGVGMTEIAGKTGQDGMAIMTQRLDQVKPLLAVLEQKRVATPDAPPFQKVVSIYDLIPEDQEEKCRLLHQIRARLEKIHSHGGISAEDWAQLVSYLPPSDLKPFDVADLPEKIVRPFTERDGTRGRIVYVVPTDGKSVRDMRYLLKWADAYRETRLPSGEVIYGSGRAVIFADMLSGVVHESPRAVLFAALVSALVVLFSFLRLRHWRWAFLVLGSLLVGVTWMGALFWGLGIKINFLNFIAVPITIGVGVDYAINLVHRWRIQGPGHVPTIVRETGGAVILCSLTTVLGYLALMQSVNPAVRSFGLAAVIGELTCLLAVIVVLPAVLKVAESRGALLVPDREPTNDSSDVAGCETG